MKIRWMWLVLFAALALFGCGGGDVSGPSTTELVGTWNATKIEFVGKAGEGTVDAFPLGWTASLDLAADMSGELTVTRADASFWSWQGAWEVDGDLFRIAGQGADVSLVGDTLFLNGFDAAYDFDGDGLAEPAKLNLALKR